MTESKLNIRDNNALKYILALALIAFISFLSPNETVFEYSYTQGGTWRYDDLYAPFDFPLLKDEAELEVERASIELDYTPYYVLDFEVASEQKKAYIDLFKQRLKEAQVAQEYTDVLQKSQQYLRYGAGFLDRTFEDGIIDKTNLPNEELINLSFGNTLEKRTIGSLQSLEDAQNRLIDSLPYSPLAEVDFLIHVIPELMIPNVVYSDSLSQNSKAERLALISNSRGMVQKEALIVKNGDLIDLEVFKKIESYKAKYQDEIIADQSYFSVLFGYVLLAALVITIFLFYLRQYVPVVFQEFNKLFFIFIWIAIFSYLVYAIEITGVLSAYMLPFCIVPIVVKTFYSDRLAFFTHVVVILIASFISTLDYEFTFLQILAGIVAVMSDVDARNSNRFFKSILYILGTYVLGYIGLSLTKGDIWSIDFWNLRWFFVSVLLTLIAYPLIPILGRIFGFTTTLSLLELSDMNKPLLKELGLKAPGTLQHSLQVANLCEAAANKIGADELLVKVAALYHDVGKTAQPEYFIENQSGTNPHDQLSNLDSAKIIISHATKGVKMAKKQRLPEVITRFIATHHGTSRTEYFFRKHLEVDSGNIKDEHHFMYPGPLPITKEETILMMADTIEAASKSLKSPTGEDIDNLVEKLINHKFSTGQLEHSEMTLVEIEQCKEVWKQLLRSINHVRVEYPEEK